MQIKFHPIIPCYRNKLYTKMNMLLRRCSLFLCIKKDKITVLCQSWGQPQPLSSLDWSMHIIFLFISSQPVRYFSMRPDRTLAVEQDLINCSCQTKKKFKSHFKTTYHQSNVRLTKFIIKFEIYFNIFDW